MNISTIKASWSSISNEMTSSEQIDTAWIESLLEHGSTVQVKAGDTIISILDENTDTGYLLLSGEYVIQKEGDQDLEKTAPELLGEMARFNPSNRRTANVRATTDISMISFSWQKVNGVLNERLSEADFEKLVTDLEQYAWNHFMG